MTTFSRAELATIAERIGGQDFDHPFELHPDGTITDAHRDVYAPEVYNSETDDVEIDGAGWTAMTGLTGQDSYNGAVMHASEFIGGGVAEAMLDVADGSITTFVLTVVECRDPDEYDLEWARTNADDADDAVEVAELAAEHAADNPAGWAILYRA